MTQTLNSQFATPEAYVDHLNGQHPDSFCVLVYSEHMGPTAQDVADYLDMATFHDVYKDRFGFRPRGYTLEQAREWLAADSNGCLNEEYKTITDGDGWSFNGDPASIERDLEEYYGGALTDLPELEDDYDDLCDIHQQLGC